jgi:hypothetical protein
MASTITNINTAMVDQRVIEAIRSALPSLNAFSFQVSEQECVKNNVVRVAVSTDPTVGDKTSGTMKTSDGTLVAVDVTLDKFRAAGWDAKEGEIGPSLFASYWADKAAGAAYSVAKDVVDTALGLITLANYGDGAGDKLAVAAADFGQSDMAQLWEKGVGKAKRQSRLIMLNTSYSAALFGDAALAAIFANAGTNFVATGMLPTFIGMNTMHYDDFPANGQNLGGMVIGKAAIAVAMARPAELLASGDGDIMERRVITDTASGISLLLTTTGSGGGTIAGEVALLFGVKKAQDSIVRLVTA